MKIAFINPQSPFLANQNVFPPLGILYIIRRLLDYKHKSIIGTIAVFDLATEIEPYKKIMEIANKYDVFAITSTTPQYPYALNASRIIRNINNDANIIIGGVHPTVLDFHFGTEKQQINPSHPELYKKLIDSFKLFDIVVKGDAEDIFKNLIYGRYLKQIDKNPRIVENKPTDNINIFPARELVDMDKYYYKIRDKKATQILSMRGCPYRCEFCCGRNIPSLNKIRSRELDSILEELDYLNSRYGYNAFFFHDDEFNINKKRTIDLCNKLKERDYIYRAFVRANLFDNDIAKNMHDAGFVAIGCGIESGSQRILNLINKRTTTADNTRVATLCKKYDMDLKAFTIIGNLDETIQDINKTKQWLVDNKPDDFDLTIFTPYPGSNIYDNYHNIDYNFNKFIKIHPIDFTMEEEKTNYLGKKGEYRCYIETPTISNEKLLELREKLDNDICNELCIEHKSLKSFR